MDLGECGDRGRAYFTLWDTITTIEQLVDDNIQIYYIV